MKRKPISKNSIQPQRVLRLLKTKPMSVRQVTLALGYPIKHRQMIQAALSKLKAEGKVMRMRGGLYGLQKIEKTIIGQISQKQPGFAFLISDDDNQEDLYIPASNLKNALPGDQVKVSVYNDNRFGGRQRAQVIEIIKRSLENIIGTLRKQRGYYLLKPDGLPFIRDFMIAKSATKNGQDQDKVVAKVIKWPDQVDAGQAKVIEVLGPKDDPAVAMTALIRRFDLPDGFSLKALAQAKDIAVEPETSEWPDRVDCRNQPVVTIDGADARDFDDAVYCKTLADGGWHLEVHIADVAHYLKPGTVLDEEAKARGTSVYLPDRVLHMLPEELSCGVCSLVPNQDRLALSVIMSINKAGELKQTQFQRSVIRSAARLTYEWVEDVLEKKQADTLSPIKSLPLAAEGNKGSSGHDIRTPGADSRGVHNPAVEHRAMLKQLAQVSKALRANRDKRGNLDFDLPDARVVLDDQGQVKTIEKRVQLKSHQLIEDCMIAANEAVASHLQRLGCPALYRVHEPPSGEKMEEFKHFLETFGYTFKTGKAHEASKAFAQLLSSWKGKPEESVLNNALLRAMKLAVYAPVNKGHFGLASLCYTHFTSPIRRYPDLVVHRLIIDNLVSKKISGKHLQTLKEQMPGLATHLSKRERLAEKAERLAIRTKKMEFMKSKIGMVAEGIITTVKSFGFFVELKEQFVEGLVLCSNLDDDYYHYDKDQQFLAGANTGQEYRIGQEVTIEVGSVDEEEIRVYFHIIKKGKPNKSQQPNNPPRMVKRQRRTRR